MLTFFALIATQTASPQSTPTDCRYDRPAMMTLDVSSFDQDMTGGWRKLADAGCELEAADAIVAWRRAHRDVPKGYGGLLNWHEGQLRASAGQTRRAIALFGRARKTAKEDAGFGWNLYVDGSVAFLRRNRAGLEAARAKLAALPRPAGYAPVGADGKPHAYAWPMNLNVLDGFLACWGQPYKQAYACAKPPIRTLPPAR